MRNLIVFFLLIISGVYKKSISSPVYESQTRNNIEVNRIVALTSLSSDIVSSISNDSLIGIPGSSLFKSNDDFKNKVIISSGRNPPNLEKIIKLNFKQLLGKEI